MCSRIPFLLAICGLFILATGCISNSAGGGEEDGNLTVAVSILPQAEFVEAVGGKGVEVLVMVPPGASPATYEPTTDQLMALTSADMYVKVGSPLPFETLFLPRLIDANPSMVVVDSGEGIEIVEHDPHTWNSPPNAMIMVDHIAEALAEIDPAHREQYLQNRDAYLAGLNELDADIRTMFMEKEQRSFMVFHPAWGYFAREYGLEQIPIEIEGKEPSPGQLAALIRRAEEEHITVIFVNPQMSTESAEVIAQQIGATLVPADPLARNYTENLRDFAEHVAGEGTA
jgi:zinc transport system substrate-binding protein